MIPACLLQKPHLVDLFTRAWIEIDRLCIPAYLQAVALFTRAWIEIMVSKTVIKRCQSPSSRGRGLKFLSESTPFFSFQSPSSRGRGLKCYAYYITFEEAVATYYSMSRNSRIVLIRDKGFGNVYFELKYVEICIKYSALLDIRCAVC